MRVSNGIARVVKRLSCLAALALVVLMAPVARANTFLFTGNNGGLPNNGPYAQVTTSLADSTITYNVTALTPGGSFTDFGFNLNSSNLIGPVSTSVVSLSPGYTATSSGMFDGWGTFNVDVGPGPNAQGNRLTSETIIATFASATDASNLYAAENSFSSSVLSTGGNGSSLFALHFFEPGGTGWTAVVKPVPEPSSMVILGISLFSLGLVRRWRPSAN